MCCLPCAIQSTMVCAAACASCSIPVASCSDRPLGSTGGSVTSEAPSSSSGQLRANAAGHAAADQSIRSHSTAYFLDQASRKAASSASGSQGEHQNSGEAAHAAARCMAVCRATPGSRASRSTCHSFHTSCASSDSSAAARGESCFSAACQRSSTDSGCASADGNKAEVSSSAMAIRVCASGIRSVLRRAANNFFNQGVSRSDAYRAISRSVDEAGASAATSGGCWSSQESSVRICGGMKLPPSSAASALRNSAIWVNVGTSTKHEASPESPVRRINRRAACGQKAGPGGRAWTVWGMRVCRAGAGMIDRHCMRLLKPDHAPAHFPEKSVMICSVLPPRLLLQQIPND